MLLSLIGHVPQGSIPILVVLTDDVSEYRIPRGAKSQVAIYSDHMKPLKNSSYGIN